MWESRGESKREGEWKRMALWADWGLLSCRGGSDVLRAVSRGIFNFEEIVRERALGL